MTEAFDYSAAVISRNGREHHCFGCGTLNDSGLQLAFRRGPAGVWAELRPDRRYEGYVGMVHGGMLSAMLDEAMSWAITAGGDFAVTARLNISFRAPARIGALLRVEGRVEAIQRRLIITAATVTDVDADTVIADAEGRFMRVSAEQAALWQQEYIRTDGA